MAAIHELLKQVQDPILRARLQEEFDHATQNKKFGLVFEEHLPECTPLYGISVKKGGAVAKKDTKISDTYTVIKLNGDKAICRNKVSGDVEEISKDELVAIAEFGQPIFPYLEHIDSVENAPDSNLWHTLIEADNYHALQLLEYLYPHKVDCIYIDPPYNTGARDWKYNNDYVDASDAYRHSKWLSMMQKRLRIAKRLLNPENSVLIVTIDEKEYLHLGCLLEEMFPEARMQMVSTVINRQGTSRTNEFSRINEYIFFLMFGNCEIAPLSKSEKYVHGNEIRWITLRRSNASNIRTARPNQFYPIYVDRDTMRIKKIGDVLPPSVDRNAVPQLEGCDAVFPIRDDGTEMLWGVVPDVLRDRLEKGYVKVCGYHKNKPQPYVIQYLTSGTISEVENDVYDFVGRNKDGSVIAIYKEAKAMMPKSQWDISEHDASYYGTRLIKSILQSNRFTFPKSIYAVRDTIKYFVTNNPNALIVDFFAGSGTTLHAVNLLNAEDGGHRRCIMVTNNEVSDDEAKSLKKRGYQPGDEEWEKLGIARYVTWPRTVCSIEGHDVNGNPLKGGYLGSDIPMSDGFAANCEYFKLGFLDKDMVSLGRQFCEILPLLWMKSGAIGKRPDYSGNKEPQMLVLPKNHFAVLVDESCYAAFAEEIRKHDTVDTVYFITNSESAYHEMSQDLGIADSYQLYRNYLDNFVIGARRDRR